MKISKLLSKESKWCQGHNALKEDNSFAPTSSAKAAKWCLLGAAYRCYGKNISKYYSILELIRKELGIISNWKIAKYNDHPRTTFKDIKYLVNKLDI